MRRFLIVLAALALAGAQPLRAQTAGLSTLQPGTRVRVLVPRPGQEDVQVPYTRWVVGTVQEVDSAFLTLRVEGLENAVTYPFSSLRDAEVSAGRISGGTGIARGTVRGAVASGGVALVLQTLRNVVSLGNENSAENDLDECNRQLSVASPWLCRSWANVGIATGVGAALGAASSAVLNRGGTDRWRKLNVAGPPEVAWVDGRPALLFTLRR